MILARRPLLIFDVDVIGLGVLVGLAALAYVVAIRPQREDARRLAAATLQLDQARMTLQQQRDRLRAVQDQTQRLAALLSRRGSTDPPVRSMAEHVSLVLAAAGRSGLEVLDFTPSEQRGEDAPGLTLRARGRSRAVLEFLHACARREPRHRIERFLIRGQRQGGCDFECVMRFLRPPAATADASKAGERP